MIFKNALNILLSYGRWLPQILFYEILYLLKGYKRNSFNILNNERFTDNIPCPYFFLHKLKSFFLNANIKSFVDLGCGDGRSIFFFYKHLKIKFYGIEYNSLIYNSCQKSFKDYNNVHIVNDDIMSFKFLEFNSDCFFIGDPLKKKYDFDNLIKKILQRSIENKKRIYFIIVNVEKDKREVFLNYKLIDSFQKNNRGYYIYTNEEINENPTN
jgi:SAM-dependent methyltransferase